ncbi:MAG: tRNA lysidine(34) synthetase TilS [Aquificaceae bacterium]|nr:tRNA lysidine(34) synthetase TilS [Aquificaceae bacterium]MDW8096517.1 tRNA lysidine(34) synthetase TilS [Aquificaceae bacterium]
MRYHPLLRKVVSLQRSKKLLPPHSKVLVAFSGGVDSVALVLSLIELKNFLLIQDLALLHINHGLRGEEALRDELFCQDFARRKGLRLFVERLHIDPQTPNLEAVARELRYRALERVRSQEGFDFIATAHHLNDLVETVLLWLVRGAGREGLLGFEERQGKVVRPLYYARREEIESFVKARGEEWVEDSTNQDFRFARNLIRHRVVPELKKINPKLEESFLRLREILWEEESLLKRLTEEALRQTFTQGQLDRRAFLKLPRALQRRVLYHLYGPRGLKPIESTINSVEKGSHLKSLGA